MSDPPPTDPAPLTRPQLRALLAVLVRELRWGLGEVSNELAAWRDRAATIPDDLLRRDALYSLACKRTHADGAALFSALPDTRDCNLLRLLVAYETILDYLDEVSERHPTETNGRELHQALIDALTPGNTPADYYRHHPRKDDAGYLQALVEACRRRCHRLPSHTAIRPLLARELRRIQVLALNHLLPAAHRDHQLQQWARREFPDQTELAWYELSAAASASLVVHSQLALAAQPTVATADIEATYAAYWPWASLATAMLDSYVDQDEDTASGSHSYIAHYQTTGHALHRLSHIIARASHTARASPNGHRNAVIVSAMTAMYLSKNTATTPHRQASTRQLLHAGGSLTRLLSPALRTWRHAYRQRTA